MTEPKVVGVFGISGVGKSTLIRQSITASTSWEHIQASELIKTGLGDQDIGSEFLRRSSRETILDNQTLLVKNFWSLIRPMECTIAILDGHLVVDTDECLVEIPMEVIARLKPRTLLHIEDNPEEICNRRKADRVRRRPIRTPEMLESCQRLSADLCLRYGRELNVPVSILGPSDSGALTKFLRTL